MGLNNSDGKSYNPKYSHSSFVLLKNGEEVTAYVMTVVADSNYINGDLTKLQKNKYSHHDKDFSGLVIYSTPKGDFVSGFILQNGIVLQKLEKRIAPTGQSNTRGKQNLDLKTNQVQMVEVCTAWYQWGYDKDGNVINYHYVDTICHTYYVDDGGGNGSVGTVPTEGGGGSGSGSTGTTSPNPSPCTPTAAVSVKNGGGLKINLVQPPDGGFPPPTDPGPCTTAAEGFIPLCKSSIILKRSTQNTNEVNMSGIKFGIVDGPKFPLYKTQTNVITFNLQITIPTQIDNPADPSKVFYITPEMQKDFIYQAYGFASQMTNATHGQDFFGAGAQSKYSKIFAQNVAFYLNNIALQGMFPAYENANSGSVPPMGARTSTSITPSKANPAVYTPGKSGENC